MNYYHYLKGSRVIKFYGMPFILKVFMNFDINEIKKLNMGHLHTIYLDINKLE